MDGARVLQSLEEMLLEIVAAVAFWPKTLFLLLSRTRPTLEGIDAEFAKPASDRYETFVSPIAFLAITYILRIDSKFYRLLMDTAELRPFIRDTVGQSPLAVLALSIAIPTIVPLTFAMTYAIVGGRGERVTKTHLMIRFGRQCYIFSVMLLGTVLYERLDGMWSDREWTGAFVPFALWFFYGEAVALQIERDMELMSALMGAAATFLLSLFVTYVVAALLWI